jgi:hypothetical protein
VPTPASSFAFTWTTIASKTADYAANPRHTARRLTDEASQLYPFINKGKIDVSKGHHDAGDYSKYTINTAGLIHYLMFAVDSFAGVADLDNLGIPESGDGISALMQIRQVGRRITSPSCRTAMAGFYYPGLSAHSAYTRATVTPRQRRVLRSSGRQNTAVTRRRRLRPLLAQTAFLAEIPSSGLRTKRGCLHGRRRSLAGNSCSTRHRPKYGKYGSYQEGHTITSDQSSCTTT